MVIMNEKMKKIIFLDIDGVLNTRDWHSRMTKDTPRDEFGWVFDPVAVENLAHIINETGANIVVSSSWKYLGMTKLKEMWDIRNLPGDLLDITPNTVSDEILLNANLDEIELGVCRGNEIKEWLSKHKGEVSNYVIIDDFDDLLPEQMCHAVITNTLIGITESDAEKAITILNG
jgi:hypothetical protein